MRILIFLLLLVFWGIPVFVSAQWSNESELGVIAVSGNAESSSLNLKQLTEYELEKDKYTGRARYTEAEAADVLVAESWVAGLRYDRELEAKTSAYLAYDVESDRFAGYLQRDQASVGLSQKFLDQEELKWVAEVGYSHLDVDFANSNATNTLDGARLFTNISGDIYPGIIGAFFIEYRHYFDDWDPAVGSDLENYLINAEPSVFILFGNVLSLKMAYLVKYQNQLPAGVTERTDTTYSTTLVAKF